MPIGTPAGILSVLVTAQTGQANAALTKTRAQFRATAGTAAASSKSTGASWKRAGVAVAAGAGLVGAASVKMAVDFDKAMRNVNSIAQLPERQFQRLRQSVLDLAGPTAQAPETIAEGMYDLVSSGFDAAESLKIVKQSARAATAGLTDTAVSTKAVAAVLNAYRRPAEDAKDVSDTLFRTVDRGVITFEDLASNIGDTLPFAATLGVGLDQLGASTATMTKQGLSASETMTRIRNILQTLIKPGDDLSQAFRELGTSGEELVAKKGLQGALEAIIDTTDGTKSEVAKLFPNIRALGGALALTGGNAKAANEDLKGLQDSSGAMARALSQQSQSAAFQFQQLKAEVSATAIEFGTALLPAAVDAARVLGDIVTATIHVGQALTGMNEGLKLIAFSAVGAAVAMKGLMIAAPAVRALGSNVAFVGSMFATAASQGTMLATAGTLLRTAFMAHPLLAVAGGAAVLTTTVLGLTGAFDALFGSQKKIPGMQANLRRTSEELADALKNQRRAVGAAEGAADRVRKAHRREQEATESVNRAEGRLKRVRQNYPANAKPVIEAEADLVAAKKEERRATNRLEKAEREQGVVRKSLKPVLRETVGTEKERILILKQQRDNLIKTLKEQTNYTRRTGQGLDELKATQSKLDTNTKELSESRKAFNNTLQEAADRVGKNFAKRIAEMTVSQAKFGLKTKDASKILRNPFTSTIQATGEKIDLFGTKVHGIGDSFTNAATTGANALKRTEQNVQGAGKALGFKVPNFGIKGASGEGKKERKMHGGVLRLNKGAIVQGYGSGDHVPVHVGGQLAAYAEPGELVSVANKSATASLMAVNAKVKRQAQGGVTAGPFQTRADVLGSGPGFVPYMNYLNSMFGPLNVISGLRPGSITTSGNVSNHSWGGAVDISTPGGEGASSSNPMTGAMGARMDAAYGWIRKYFAPMNLDLLWRTLVGGNHYNHIHSGIERAFSFNAEAMSNYIAKLPKGGGFGEIKDLMITGPDGSLKDMIQTMSDLVIKKANTFMSKHAMTPQFGKQDLGNVHGEQFMSTSYGPPWGGIQGTGVTATGVNLLNSPHIFGVAVDPNVIPLGSQLGIAPNPFNTRSAFKAFDTGGAIQGNRIDFYDWRGRDAQLGWGERPVQVETMANGGVLRLKKGGMIAEFVDQFKKQQGAGDRRKLTHEMIDRIRNSNRFNVPFLNTGGDSIIGDMADTRLRADKFGTFADLASQMSGDAPWELVRNTSKAMPWRIEDSGELVSEFAKEEEARAELARLQDTVLGRFHSKTEGQWLGGTSEVDPGQLQELLKLRNRLVSATGKVKHVKKIVDAMIKTVEEQISKVREAIKVGERLRSDIEDQRTELEQALKGASDKQEESRDRIKKRLDRELAKPPKKRDEALIAQYRHDIKEKSTERQSIKDALAHNKDRMQRLNSAQADRAALMEALKGKVKPAFATRASALNTGAGTLATELDTVQGPVGILEHKDGIPPFGLFAGEIFETQRRLKDLQTLPAEFTDAAEDAASDTGGFNIGDLIEFARAIDLGAYSREAFAGTFAKGGFIPGGKFGIAGERGPEIVRGPAQVYSKSRSQSMMSPTIIAHIYMGNREITDIVRAEVEIIDSSDALAAAAKPR